MSKLVICYIRRLTDTERNTVYQKTGNRYKWVTEGEMSWKHGDEIIKVPKGFLADGSSGGPDVTDSWMVHDWLYRVHKISDRPCTRREADDVMIDILKYQRHGWYAWVVSCIFKTNPFWLVSNAWETSGSQGPQFIDKI